MLASRKNQFGGALVDPATLPNSKEDFENILNESLTEWTTQEIKVVWLEIPPQKSDLIQIAISNGFEFHHCSSSKLVLTKRLINDSFIPSAFTHTIGVGAVVLVDRSDRKEVLTVLERADVVARPDYYKLPGGMLERGEHMAEGVVREVFEETGIKSEFQGLLSFRHHHKGQFGSSNIYAVCLLKPLTFDISIDEVEIGKAMWISVDEYLASEGVGAYNKRVVRAAISSKPLISIKLDGYMDSPDEYEIYVPESFDL